MLTHDLSYLRMPGAAWLARSQAQLKKKYEGIVQGMERAAT